MKSSTIISSISLITFLFIFGSSCQKETTPPPPPPCPTCDQIPVTHSVNLAVTNWTTNGDGFFKSDIAAPLKEAAGEYNSIVKAYVVTSTNDIEIGYSTPINGGSISRNGSLLIFKSGLYNQIPFVSLEIRVEVN